MRSAVYLAPFVAAAYSATTTSNSKSYTLVPELSGSKTVTSTYTYSNAETKYTTETNSVGVVTGMPGASTVITSHAAVTSQPPVATIPAGESTGYHTLTLNVSSHLTSFTISVGKKTTNLVGGAQVSTVAGGSSSAAAGGAGPHHTGVSGGGSHHGGSNGGSNGGSSSSSSGSASATQTGSGSASNVKVASAGMIGLGALFAALL